MRAVRVAFCIDNMNLGGTELNAVRLAPHLQAAGVDLRIFTLARDGPLLARYDALGIPVEQAPIARLYGRSAWEAGRRLKRWIRRERIPIVHAHDFYSNIFAAPWARLAGARFLASRRWWEGPDRRAQRWANRASYLLAHRVVANSPAVADLLVRSERVGRHRVVVVPNFLDAEAFAPPPPGWVDAAARELNLPDDRLVVGAVANLSPVKNHALLVEAADLLRHRWPRLHVVLVGADAGSQSELVARVEQLGLADRVHFAGPRPPLPSPHLLFDISVLTSRSEGLPNSVLEAMAAGRPIVATEVGAVADAVADGETGYLVPPGDPRALADRIDRLLADPGLRARLGARGAQVAGERYTAGAAVAALLRVYQDLARMDR